ncbi:acyltransferase family protein [Pilimelia columellifera]|uniref:SGNH hydrolase domain-containing protein n=1 Tax=Pilimelia columellifera subsp. columellifera TaxID=706583 RepID=A0ABP6ASQ2_9ACTN
MTSPTTSPDVPPCPAGAAARPLPQRAHEAAPIAPEAPAPPARRALRGDIEGLRAIAVLLVVLSHAGVTSLAGGFVGVDVFFVISGYVITAGLLREAARTGTVSLRTFYARRAVRLIPAAAPVLVAVLVGAWLLTPLRAVQTAWDVIASSVYLINLRLAQTGTDYFAAGEPPSPVQHFWSLAVEEQFYLLWPLLLLLLLRRSRRDATDGLPRRRILTWVAVIAVASLALSVWLSARHLAWAYFGSPTRVWELAAGALLATATVRMPTRARLPLAVAGLGAIAAAALAFDERTVFPGYAALLPVAGTVAVIAAGAGGSAGLTDRLLGSAPARLLGKLSYSWYLWHWPALVFGAALLGRAPHLVESLGFVTVALGLAAASHHWLENPVRHRPTLRHSPRRGLALGGSLSAATAAVAVLATLITPTVAGRTSADDPTELVAEAPSPQRRLTQLLAASAARPVVPANLTPPLVTALENKPTFYRDGCHELDDPARNARKCRYGAPDGARTVVLLGDSHAGHWFPALNTIAVERGWRLIVFVRNECSAASVTVFGFSDRRLLPECTRWRKGALEQIRKLAPDLIVTSSIGSSTTAADGGPDNDQVWVRGWLASLEKIKAKGARVAYINTTPHLREDLLPCLAANLDNAAPCQRSQAEAVPLPDRRRAVAGALAAAGASVIEPTPWLCTKATCPALVGNTLVYRDNTHLTTHYSTLLTPMLAARLDKIMKARTQPVQAHGV